MDNHLTEDPPKDESRLSWMRDDARLFLQIRNSIDSEVVGLVTHCRIVKELLNYLEFLYSEQGNISHIYDVCKAFYRADKGDRSLTNYFIKFKKTYEELNMLLPFSTDITVQQTQREKMVGMSLPCEFEIAKSQILSGSKISSLQDAFSRVFRIESSSNIQSTMPNSALISHHNIFKLGKQPYRSSGNNKSMGSTNYDKNTGTRRLKLIELVCHYCHKPGHIKRECPRF